jgi:uncharacterized protein
LIRKGGFQNRPNSGVAIQINANTESLLSVFALIQRQVYNKTMKIKRFIKNQITEDLKIGNKAVVIYGARQTGKTTLVNEIIEDLGLKTLKINADQPKYNNILESGDKEKLEELIGQNQLLFIDEAQRIENIGLNLKIIIDSFPDLKIIVTGSSSFDLANKVQEPLTGRKWSYKLFPISDLELKNHYSDFDLKQSLSLKLVYGSYPDLYNISGKKSKKKYLYELANDYLYKDALEIVEVKNAKKIKDLLKLISYQVGSNTSYSELADNLDLSKETVKRYLDILEKSFVIFRLTGFSRNLRKEITKTPKYYFYDLGIRNTLIDNLNDLERRNPKEIGQLFENYLIIERLKKNAYTQNFLSSYFWRTYTGAEIDYIEEKNNQLNGYEFKYKKKTVRTPKTWLETYDKADFKVINKENYLNFTT